MLTASLARVATTPQEAVSWLQGGFAGMREEV
jgi:hypothetical protein